MNPLYLTMIGLVFDIVGGFFVSVEAIKIGNLRMLRDFALKRANSYILGPRIMKTRILDDEDCGPKNTQKNVQEEPLPAMGCLPLLTLHVVVGFIVLLLLYKLVYKLTDGMVYTTFLLVFANLNSAFKVFVILLSIILGVGYSGAIGSGIFSAFSLVLQGAMKVIDFIEAKTPKGTTGIIGFLFLALGFLLQFLATYLTLQRHDI